MTKPIKKNKLFRLENAQTMVEFAMVFPVILLITYGIMEFGRMLWIYTSVTGAARDGARYGAASGSLTDPFFRDCSGIIDATQRRAVLFTIPSGNITVWWDTGPNSAHLPASSGTKYSCPGNPPPVDRIDKGDRVGVLVTAHYAPMIPFLGFTGFDITKSNARTIVMNVPVGNPYP